MSPPEQHTGPPDFVGVGTQRSGTTWWFRELLSHPGIRAPRKGRKELHFFDRYGAEPLLDEHIPEYFDLFRRHPHQICGEWTPRYMGDPWTLRLLKRVVPDAKLLVLLRDPIERYRSGIVHEASRSRKTRKRFQIASDAIERGRYATQLRRVYDHFDADRVLVLQYERCTTDTLAQYARTLRFLGVDDSHVPEDMKRARGTTMAAKKTNLWADMLEGLHAALDGEVLELRTMVPDLDVSAWPNFAHLVEAPVAG